MKYDFDDVLIPLFTEYIKGNEADFRFFIVKGNGKMLSINGKSNWRSKGAASGAITLMLNGYRYSPDSLANQLFKAMNITPEYNDDKNIILEFKKYLMEKKLIEIIEVKNEISA